MANELINIDCKGNGGSKAVSYSKDLAMIGKASEVRLGRARVEEPMPRNSWRGILKNKHTHKKVNNLIL
jgi:hypothetical protein